ncbi:acyl-ACP desaturase [Streptomyces daliensis]
MTEKRQATEKGNRSAEHLLAELEPAVVRQLERHLETAREWFPHEYVPWSEGENFDGPLGGRPWEPKQSRLAPAVRTALIVNLLTEDNLPIYHHQAGANIGREGAWGEWLYRWTAEEDRHATAIRGFLHTTRAVDPVALERTRMQHMSAEWDPGTPSGLHAIAYVTVQELATRVAHRNTGKVSEDEDCVRLLSRIALDENLHMVFYREVFRDALELAPAQALAAFADTLENFAMPGSNAPGFPRMAAEIARAGIYNLRVHHDEVVTPLLRSLGVLDMTGLDAEGTHAQQRIAAHAAGLDAKARRFDELWAEREEIARRAPHPRQGG